MSKKTLLLIAGSFVLLVAVGGARSAYLYIQEQSEAHQREVQIAQAQKATQDAMKQWQQQMGAYSQMQQQMQQNMPNFANMNLPAGTYPPGAQMAMVTLIQKGISPNIALQLTQAKVQVISQSNTSLRYTLSFPNGIKSDTTLNIIPDQKYSPTQSDLDRARSTGHAIYNVKLSAKQDADKTHLILQYFVPYSQVPTTLQQRIHGQSAANFGLLTSVYADEGNIGVGIAQDTGIEIAKEILKEKAEDTKLAKEFPTPLSRLVDILNAFKKEQDHIQWLDELGELADCAENPTNPLTQKAYDENPAYKQQTLNNLAEAHSDVSQATAMRFLNLATSVATDFVDGPLGAVTAPISSYNDDALKGIAENRINDIKKSVTDCNPYKGYGDMYPPLHGTVEYSYNRTTHEGGDGWTRDSTETRKLAGELDLGYNPNDSSGVLGTATYERQGKSLYKNSKGQAEDTSADSGPVEINGQMGGSGAVGWVQLGFASNTIHFSTKHNDNFGKKPNITELNGGNGSPLVGECKFTGVDLRKGGTYSSFVEADKGYGTCKIELTPK